MNIMKVKNIRGRIVAYRAERGSITADGTSPAEAKQMLESAIDAAIDRLSSGTMICQWKGHTVVISPTDIGWSYWLDTFSQPDYRPSGYETRQDTRAAAFFHLAQNAWDHDCPDDERYCQEIPICETKQKDMLSWCRWQRSYRQLRNQGMSDAQAHQNAFAYC